MAVVRTGGALRPSTQYTDADLTIGDVIEADADMAEQIAAGADRARVAVDSCDRLTTCLEALHGRIVELEVPGVLEGLLFALVERTASIKAKAEAISELLPVASEAIATAGANAADRHKGLADAVADAGHIKPAEREYHGA